MNLGFAFEYNGANYTTMCIDVNGFIAMGNSIGSNDHFLVLSDNSNANNVIAGLNFDLEGVSVSELRYQTLGIAPNRVCVVQWSKYKRVGIIGNGDSYDFQIRLNETTNKIEIVYGVMTTVTGGVTYDRVGMQVGLRGESASDFNDRANLQSFDWAASTRGASNLDTCIMIADCFPVSGLTYTWTPLSMTYVSSTTTQALMSAVDIDTKNNQIIGIKVVADGMTPPIAVTGFTLTSNRLNKFFSGCK